MRGEQAKQEEEEEDQGESLLGSSSPPPSASSSSSFATNVCSLRCKRTGESERSAHLPGDSTIEKSRAPGMQKRDEEEERQMEDWRKKKKKKKRQRHLLFRFLDKEGEEELHINIYLMFYFRMLNALAYAARAAAVFDSYLHLKFGGNQVIGTLTSFSGIVTIFIAPLAGVLSDRYKIHRSKFLQFAALFAVACIYVNWLAVSRDDFSLFLLTTFMWKGWYEFVTVCTESLFNDSIPQGRRSELYVHRRIVTTLANGVGPLFSLFVFYVEGNSWNLSVLHTVLHVGIILSLPQAFVLWIWQDVLPPSSSSSSLSLSSSSSSEDMRSESKRLPSHPNAPLKTPSSRSPPGAAAEAKGRGGEGEPSVLYGSSPQSFVAVSASSAKKEEKEKDVEDSSVEEDAEGKRGILTGVSTHHSLDVKKDLLGERKERRKLKKSSAVPWLVFISHCITFSGAGMTVKYFPLFFKSEYQLQPMHMCLLSSVYTLFIAFFTYLIQRMAVHIGRPQASLLSTGLGITCLFLLSYFRYFPLVVLVYLLRGALQNASTPIDRSLAMDFIDPKNVGKWSALQSLSTMMWSLSAFLGGLLVDRTSYRSTFLITGCVYILAELVYLPVLWLVPRELDVSPVRRSKSTSRTSSSG